MSSFLFGKGGGGIEGNCFGGRSWVILYLCIGPGKVGGGGGGGEYFRVNG